MRVRAQFRALLRVVGLVSSLLERDTGANDSEDKMQGFAVIDDRRDSDNVAAWVTSRSGSNGASHADAVTTNRRALQGWVGTMKGSLVALAASLALSGCSEEVSKEAGGPAVESQSEVGVVEEYVPEESVHPTYPEGLAEARNRTAALDYYTDDEIVEYAIQICAEFAAGYTHRDLVRSAIQRGDSDEEVSMFIVLSNYATQWECPQ